MRESASGAGVYVSSKDLTHFLKTGRAESGEVCWFEFEKMPCLISFMADFWLASDGRWQGFFHIEDFDYEHKHITFHSNSWHQLVYPRVMRKPFKGFTYRVPTGQLVVTCGDAVECVNVDDDGCGCHLRIGHVCEILVKGPDGAWTADHEVRLFGKPEVKKEHET